MLPLVTASFFSSIILSFIERSFYFLYLLFYEMWSCLLHFGELLLRANFVRSGLWQEGVPVFTSAPRLASVSRGLWSILSAPQVAQGLCLQWASFLLVGHVLTE